MQLERPLDPQRRYWLQVVRGAMTVAGRELAAGDAIGLVEEAGTLTVVATQASEVLLFDLP
jgi:redox-sensitive bicupin YhaK (pirin superfamily)